MLFPVLIAQSRIEEPNVLQFTETLDVETESILQAQFAFVVNETMQTGVDAQVLELNVHTFGAAFVHDPFIKSPISLSSAPDVLIAAE